MESSSVDATLRSAVDKENVRCGATMRGGIEADAVQLLAVGALGLRLKAIRCVLPSTAFLEQLDEARCSTRSIMP